MDFQPNLEDSDTQVDGMLFHIERSFHKAQSIRMDQDIDSQYMLCYLDNRYHVDILPFVLQIILKVNAHYSTSFNDGLNHNFRYELVRFKTIILNSKQLDSYFLYIVGTDLLQNQEDMYTLLCDFQQSK